MRSVSPLCKKMKGNNAAISHQVTVRLHTWPSWEECFRFLCLTISGAGRGGGGDEVFCVLGGIWAGCVQDRVCPVWVSGVGWTSCVQKRFHVWLDTERLCSEEVSGVVERLRSEQALWVGESEQAVFKRGRSPGEG